MNAPHFSSRRGQWGFDGYITGDCGAVKDVLVNHHYTTDGNVSDLGHLPLLKALPPQNKPGF